MTMKTRSKGKGRGRAAGSGKAADFDDLDAAQNSDPASICAGTRIHRPIVDHPRWLHLEIAALRRGCDTSTILLGIIDRFIAGNRRGPGHHAEQYRAVEELLRHVALDLIRYEGALANFVTGLESRSDRAGLAGAEADDFLASLASAALDANGALRRDVSELQELMKSKPAKEDKEP
jgi:hypothetical protein